MNKELFEHFRDLTYEDLWNETLLLEKSEATEERNSKINLLRTKAEFYQLINKLKRMEIEIPEFINQFDLVSFFKSDCPKENEKKIILLKSRLTRLQNSGSENIVET